MRGNGFHSQQVPLCTVLVVLQPDQTYETDNLHLQNIEQSEHQGIARKFQAL